jgi:outer membrane protein OmpA-like peptidoglycan-associated protein
MKTFIFFARVGFLTFLTLVQSAQGAPEQNVSEDFPNYVVIGAFAIENNAVKFTHQANELKFPAQFDINPNRNLYYVFVMTTSDREEAIREAVRLRKDTRYGDAWVYQGAIGKIGVLSKNEDHRDVDPVSGETITKIEGEETKKPADFRSASDEVAKNAQATTSTETSPEPFGTETKPETTGTQSNPTTNNPQSQTLEKSTDPVSVSETSTSDNTITSEEAEGKSFVFKLFRTMDNQPVEGEVDIIDAEKSKKMATFKTSIPVKVSKPPGKSGSVSFVCEIFGYRKVQRDFNFNDPSLEGIARDESGNLVVPFELVRLQKGDIAVMYNVYYFKDAAVMRPESRYEVTNLLDMLKENPNYKIKIHGHTNGGAHGKIISMGPEKNFFSLTGTRDGFGSAKKLSEERANTIRDYMLSNGIDEKRMSVKAWGGKRPIHDKHATRAHENVRVEIEILEH